MQKSRITFKQVSLSCMLSLLLVSGCSDNSKSISILQKQTKELKGTIQQLEADNKKLTKHNTDLTAKVKMYASHGKDGLNVEELRKAQATREAKLERVEDDLIKKKEIIRQREMEVLRKESEFYEGSKMTLSEIGEAKQIKVEYENMREARVKAESRANSWLIYFSILLVLAFSSILLLVVYSMKHYQKNRQIDAAIKIIENAKDLPSHERELLAQAFCQPLIDSSSRDPSDSDIDREAKHVISQHKGG